MFSITCKHRKLQFCPILSQKNQLVGEFASKFPCISSFPALERRWRMSCHNCGMPDWAISHAGIKPCV
jgi:hypothetical protein